MRNAISTAFFIAFLISFSFLPSANAQSCFGDGANAPGGTTQVNGFTIEVKIVPDPSAPGEFLGCRVSIKSPEGAVVFENTDAGIDIDPVTGKDVNGDGEPDAVIEANSGGMHCCSVYTVVSLSRKPDSKPGLVAQLGGGEGETHAEFSDMDRDGRIEITLYDGRFAYWDDMSYAFSPMPWLVLHLEGTAFRDVSFLFAKSYDAEIADWAKELTPSDLDAFRSQRGDKLQLEPAKSRAASIALSYLYSAREQQAWSTLLKMWPQQDLARVREEMRTKYCATLAEYLASVTAAPCQPGYNYPQ